MCQPIADQSVCGTVRIPQPTLGLCVHNTGPAYTYLWSGAGDMCVENLHLYKFLNRQSKYAEDKLLTSSAFCTCNRSFILPPLPSLSTPPFLSPSLSFSPSFSFSPFLFPLHSSPSLLSPPGTEITGGGTHGGRLGRPCLHQLRH